MQTLQDASPSSLHEQIVAFASAVAGCSTA